MTVSQWIVIGSVLLVGMGLGALLMSRHLMREIRQWRTWDEEVTAQLERYAAALDLQAEEAQRAYRRHPGGGTLDLARGHAEIEALKADALRDASLGQDTPATADDQPRILH